MCDSLETADERLGLHNASIMWSYRLFDMKAGAGSVQLLQCEGAGSLTPAQLSGSTGEPTLMLLVTSVLTVMLRYHLPASLTVSLFHLGPFL